ncbi:hypothetical protein D7V91_14225, partial [bacterium 1xD42-67]
EAIEVLQAVGVMQGDDKGNFDPDRTVSRNEMAIVMAKLLNLDYNYYSESCPFWDVPDYAKPYVGACYANGIVSGYNATTYGGADTVTAVQAASMMMRALGYFQYDSDYKDGFVIATVKQASKIGLFKDINANQDSPLTRDQVAQLTLNTLESGMVEAKKTTSDISFGSGDTAVTITGAVDYVYVTSDDNKIKDAIDNVEATTIGVNNGGSIVELGEKLYNGDLKKYGEKTNGSADEFDSFGRPSVTWTYKNDKVGTYAKEADLIATYTKKVSKGDIYGLLSSAVRSDLEKSAATLTVTVDGYANGSVGGKAAADTLVPANWYVRNSSDAVYTFGGVTGSSRNGTLTEVYLDKDNNVDIVIINTFVYQATSDYSSNRDDVKMAPAGDTALALKAGELTLKGEDFNIQDVKTDDYLLITAASKTGSAYEVQSVKVAEKVTGEVTGYADKDSVTIDGTTYNYSATTNKDGSYVRDTTYTVGQDAIVVLDEYGYVIAVDEAVSSNSFVFIEDLDGTSGLTTKAVADAYFTDGTNEEITVDRVDNVKSASALIGNKGSYINKWYTYSVNSDGKYVLYALTSGRANASKEYTTSDNDTQIVRNGKVDFLKDGSAIANDKTIMLVKDKDGDMTAYTGTTNIPDINLTSTNNRTVTVYYSTNSKGYTEYAFVDLENAGSSVVDGGDDTSFLYVLRFKDTMSGANATRYWNYSTIDPETGAEEKVPFDSNYFSGAHPYELRYKPRYNSDERITSLTAVPNEWGISTGKYFNRAIAGDGTVKYSNGSLKIGDVNFIVVSDSKINLVIVKDDSTASLLADKGADHEIYFETQPQTVDSLLKDYKVTGTIAGATKSSTSSVIDTLYITVTHVGPGTPATSTDINGELTAPNAPAEVEKENVTLNSGVSVPDGKNLVLKGDVNGGGQTIAATGTTGTVELKDAAVSGSLTVTAATTLSGAVSVASGKTLDLATATLSGTLSGEGAVTVDNATVAASTTLNADSGNVNMDAATVAGTLNVNDDVTIGTATVTGTINVAADATLTVSTNVSGAGKIVAAAAGAKIAVGSSADATSLLTMVNDGVKFYDNNGDAITEAANLANKTFVWREAGWKQPAGPARAADAGEAGWVSQDYVPGGEATPSIKNLHVAVIDNATELISTTESWGVNGDATEVSAILKKWTGTEDTNTANGWLRDNPYVFIHWERSEGVTVAGQKGDITIKCGETEYKGVLDSFGTFGTENNKDNRANSYFLFKQNDEPTDAGVAGEKPEQTTSYTITVEWTYDSETKTASDTYEYKVESGTDEAEQ